MLLNNLYFLRVSDRGREYSSAALALASTAKELAGLRVPLDEWLECEKCAPCQIEKTSTEEIETTNCEVVGPVKPESR